MYAMYTLEIPLKGKLGDKNGTLKAFKRDKYGKTDVPNIIHFIPGYTFWCNKVT